MIELAASLKLLLMLSAILAVFVPFGMVAGADGARGYLIGLASYGAKLAVAGALLGVFETSIAKLRVFRVPTLLGGALMLGLLGTLLLYISRSL